MSLSIKYSVVEQFNFNGKNVRSIHVEESGECLLLAMYIQQLGITKRVV